MTTEQLAGEPLIAAACPPAARLICAVHDRDPEEVAAVLHGLDTQGLYALAVVLASTVPEDSPLACAPVSPARQFQRAVALAAAMFQTTPDRVLSSSRYRPDLNARAVAMAALRSVGHTSVAIGEHLNRDHSTVLYACSRVGESARLRRVAASIAEQIGDAGFTVEE